jgi:DNA-binding transcriptional ArsR family regulator
LSSRRDAYAAIADPTRREILDLLRIEGSLMAGEIASKFERASRPGISRHLRVLKECGVVTSQREGKRQNYSLCPKPLNDLRDGWLAGFADRQTKSLKALRRTVESRKLPKR